MSAKTPKKGAPKDGLTRRAALKTFSAATAAALIPGVGGCDDGVEPGPEPAVVDTIVVLMMENRSFDHTFGGLTLDEGRADLDGFTAQMSNALADGTRITPFPTPLADICVADPPHGWDASHRQFNDGTMSGFVTEHESRHGTETGPMAMSYLTRAQQPATYGILESGAVCNRWFSSVMGPTWPNRFYSTVCTSGGNTGNLPVAGELTTVFERVWRSGRTYGNYYGNFPHAALNARMTLSDPEFQYLERFYEDAEAGELPNLVWLDPIYGRNDDHPPAHPLAGQVLIQSIYQALKESPQWERLLFVVTYDEHGGFYDHVPPPKTEDERASDGFDQLGFRVPTLVCSPWIAPVVDDTVYDHSSIYATIAELWDLEPLTDRDAAANSFLHLLDRDAMATGTPYDAAELAPIEARDEDLFVPECLALTEFIPNKNLPAALDVDIGQPEMVEFAAKSYASHGKNRIAQTDALYRDFISFAERQGVLRRRK
ncbi:MAG: phosphoesterase [Deltaproteobacteria bacterium]|nr:phosphoesterase [Deltaproteobacteria bacterium]